MKPDKSNVLVCVEQWGNNKQHQMLRILSVNDGYDVKTFSWILEFCLKTNTPLAYQIPSAGKECRYLGDPEFLNYMKEHDKSRPGG